jgi:hypothetical protein
MTQRLVAESKDPEDAYLAYAVRNFSTTEARVQDLGEVELLFAPPAFELFPERWLCECS